MSQIRRQSIISSLMVYFGFSLGFLNTYLFTRDGGFTKEQYGLTGIFIAIATLMYSFANLGMPSYIAKFYPYYNANLDKKRNDILTWALLISLAGFCLVAISGVYFKDTIIRKFGQNSPELVAYYYWIFPFGLGLTLYSILESYAWQLKKSVLTNFLREVQFRLFTTILIILTFAGLLAKFDMFIKVYSFTYLGIALILLIYLIAKGYIHLTFTVSIISKKFFKKILTLVSFVFGGSLVFAIASVFDSILIASVVKNGLAEVAVYTLAQNIASLIQAPQRGIISSSIGALSEAWKDKDMVRINRIYKQSSINQLIFAVGMFSLIWLNFTDAVFTFHMQKGYIDAQWVFFFIGLMRIVDMGTGVNSQIIATSTRWRFEFFTGIILLLVTLPLNYILTKYYFGIIGPAIANLFSFTLYNTIRYCFLQKKFNLQPFTKQTLYTILLGLGSFYICHLLFNSIHGFAGLFARSIAFIALYAAGTVSLKLSSDVLPIWNTLVKKVGIKKGA
ncbi:MAG: lipopolysaccharide biosynthesis protein [Ferruginibacter sp.]|uniref:lipopolysaccharide biosynthesis protein n=1 Tax=Ferruginibacter sp. TaxID=1940288 RepID=UPI0026587F20|nr:polysaccharide biosynthesis C-terminal domain-containing protein [Ferruginibacter sp.]MDB5277005.1 lipopolysaccharide biosynthesis protein [Ferruginibacter sp.]